MKRHSLNTVGAIAFSGLLLLTIAGWGKLTQGDTAFAEGLQSRRSSNGHPVISSQASSPQTSPIAQLPDTMTSKLVDANTRFGFKLFSALTKRDTNNVFISPSSVAIALAMVYNGANGSTQQAIARTLEIQGMSLQELNQANADLKASLQNADPQVQLTIANSLWSQQGVSFKADFIQRNSQFYQAKLTELNFASPQAVSMINQWVSQNTRGKITEIVDRLSPSQLMVLINAIYFKGSWTRQFDTKQTKMEPFYLLNGNSKKHPMMTQQGRYSYYENDLIQAVRLPYGNRRRMSMMIVLPQKGSSLSALQRHLSAEAWMQWLGQFRFRQGSIKIPRFKLEYEANLESLLADLGMAEAFSQNADFSALSSVPAQIDEVKHKTFVEVNEEGTEAAAVTSVGIRATSAGPWQEPFNMTVDRPFFCAIVDEQTEAILFMGAIVNPNQ